VGKNGNYKEENMKSKHQNKHKIGILGGMGPQASCELLRLIISHATSKFGVRNGDEFPEIVLDSIPVTDFISDTGSVIRVRKDLTNRAKQLQAIGCKPIVIACNSAHIMAHAIKTVIPNEFRSLMEIMGAEINKLGMKKVVVFATPTTIRNHLYANVCLPLGIRVINPDLQIQKIHEQIIRKVISGDIQVIDRIRIIKLAMDMINSGLVDGVILGCTELPVAVGEDHDPRIVSSLEVLADAVLNEYYALNN
jgi:aspartate racemase